MSFTCEQTHVRQHVGAVALVATAAPRFILSSLIRGQCLFIFSGQVDAHVAGLPSP